MQVELSPAAIDRLLAVLASVMAGEEDEKRADIEAVDALRAAEEEIPEAERVVSAKRLYVVAQQKGRRDALRKRAEAVMKGDAPADEHP